MTQEMVANSPSINWRSRIIRSGSIRAGDVKPHPLNPKQHPLKQQQAVSNSLDVLGELKRIVINANNGYLVDGEQRWQIALSQGEDTPLACDWVDLSDEEHELALQILDPLAALSKVDVDRFEQLLANVADHDLVAEGPIFDLLSDLAKESGLTFGETEAAAAPDAQIDRAEALLEKWRVQPGDVWIIPSQKGGEHRLMCGDSTSETHVNKLVQNDLADCIFTDPPYAIYGSSTGVKSDVADDKMVRPFFRDILKLCKLRSRNFAHIYVCCDFRSWAAWWDIAKSLDITVKNCIVWNKKTPALGSMYRNQHEFILFAVKTNGSKVFMTNQHSGQRTVTQDTNVWDQPRVVSTTKDHNAQKPVALIMRALKNSTDRSGLIFDPFGGSGTTMVACEQSGRLCRMMEIEPKYCAVILERMSDMGLAPKREQHQDA